MISTINTKTICEMIDNYYQTAYENILEKYYDYNDKLYTLNDCYKNNYIDLTNHYMISIYNYLRQNDIIKVSEIHKILEVQDEDKFRIRCDLFNNGCMTVSLINITLHATFYFNIQLRKNYFLEVINDKLLYNGDFEKEKVNYMCCF